MSNKIKRGIGFISILESAQQSNSILLLPFILSITVMGIYFCQGFSYDTCVSVGLFTSVVLYSMYIFTFVFIPENYRINQALYEKYKSGNGLVGKDGKEYVSKTSDTENELELLMPESKDSRLRLTKEELVAQLTDIYNQIDDEGKQRILQLAVAHIFILNGLEACSSKSPCDSQYHLCYSSAELGWLAASRQMCNNPAYEWDAEGFDTTVTENYIRQLCKEENINDQRLIKLIRWSFNYGAEMYSKHGTLSGYAKSVLAGDIYDVKIDL